ncbi:MAG: sporulation integral membrane protein YtvI [Desulfotomaculaceae bacterium]|nr:sporulation integral membrane protein YtvI [Desulfotomaculaceae bacterium]
MPRNLVNILYAILAIILVIAAVKYILPILMPFIIAIVFSALMEPIIRILQHRVRIPRGISTLVAMVIVFGGIGIVLTAIVLRLVAELIHLSASLPGVVTELRVYYQDLIERLTVFYVSLPPGVNASLEQSLNNLATDLQGLITNFVNYILQFISFLPGTLTVLLVIGLATYFFARDRSVIVQLFLRITPEPWGAKSIEVMRAITAAFANYIRAQAILITITILLSISGLSLIGANYAVTVGLLIGFFDLIPVLGPATVFLPWIILSLATGASGLGIKLAILYTVLSIVRQIFETKIISASLGLHPLATLVSMYAGLKIIGVAGLVAGPILLIAIQATLKAGVLNLKFK